MINENSCNDLNENLIAILRLSETGNVSVRLTTLIVR